MRQCSTRPIAAELMGWTLGEIAAATGGRIVRGDSGMKVPRVATDSRDLAPSTLFFALRGARFDGHDFVEQALERGACGAVVSRVVAAPTGALLHVADTERALGDLARATRLRAGMKVFAIAGSNGKTTTKEMLAAICAQRWPGSVLKTPGNRNNLIGLPLTLLDWNGERVAVLEMGMNRAGEIARLTEIARPDFGAITQVSEEHLEGLGSLEGVAAAEGELFAGLPENAVAVVNGDDAWVRRQAQRFAGRKVFFGADTAIRAEHVADLGFDGVAFDLRIEGLRRRVRLRLLGRHNVANALCAAALAHAAGIEFDCIVAGLEAVQPAAMRMEVHRLKNGVVLINDAYNANPGSMLAALQALASLPGRSLAVLGEMRELGVGRLDAHRRLGERAAHLGVDLLVVVGEVAAVVASGAHAVGMRPGSIVACRTHEEAARAVRDRWQPGDAVLVKGSRGAHLEKVAELLEEAGNCQ